MKDNRSPTKEFYEAFDFAFDFYNRELFDNQLNKVLITVRSIEPKKKGLKNNGYYSKRIFAYDGGPISEIALNINIFSERSTVGILSTLVHEMVHQWREEHCLEPSDGKFEGHDDAWGKKMMEIGLIPTSTGLPGGKKKAKNMTHYPSENGLFAKKTYELIVEHDLKIPIFDSYGAYVNKGNTYMGINEELKENWILNSENPEEKEKVEKALSSLSNDPTIISANINDLIVVKKPKAKPLEPKFNYICPSCESKITGKEGLKVFCLECDELFEMQPKKERKKKVAEEDY